jgi:uncharacterized protein (TIGR03437 family)
LPQVIATVAGGRSQFRGDGGLATKAALGTVIGIAVDPAGNVFACENENNIVVKVSPAGVLTVVAGTGVLAFSGDGGPATSASLALDMTRLVAANSQVAVDAAGNLYIADTISHRVRKVSPAGIITTVAGNRNPVFAGDGGPATSASLNWPAGVAVDAAGNVYIGDTNNHRVRKVTPDGTITTIAGDGYKLGIDGRLRGDGGPATRASLNYPMGVAVDAAGTLYIADNWNHRIRKVNPQGTITTVAGSGSAFLTGFFGGGFSGDGGPATKAELNLPIGVAVDAGGSFYIADSENHRIRKVTPEGTIATVAGNGLIDSAGLIPFVGDGGPATNAPLYFPVGVVLDAAGSLYIADSEHVRVRKVGADGIITTVAGNGANRFSGDGGLSASAVLSSPQAVALDAAGDLYIADSGNRRIRRVGSDGIITTVAGAGDTGSAGDGGPATSASLGFLAGVTVDPAGNLLIADPSNNRVRKVTAGGTITTAAGSGVAGFSGDGGPATSASLKSPQAATVDRSGNLCISDSGNQRIRRVSPSGTITTLAGNGTQGFSGEGGAATNATLKSPTGEAADTAGSLYFADRDNQRIRKVGSDGTITTVAGDGFNESGQGRFAGDGGPATAASLSNPVGVALDSAGNLYIADVSNNRIRKVGLGGSITTVAGNGKDGVSGDGGSATEASLSSPKGVAVDQAGSLYIADTGNNRVRRVLAAPPSYAVAPLSLTFSGRAGAPAVAAQLLAVTSTVSGLVWSASASSSWITVSPALGTMPGLISVAVSLANLTPGTYRGTVTVQALQAASPIQTAAIELTVLPTSSAQLTVDRSSILFEASATMGNRGPQTLRVGNSGTGSLAWSARAETLGGGAWLSISPVSGAASAASPATLQVGANATGLAAGVYSGMVHLESPGSQILSIAVEMVLSQATQTLLLTQTAMRFTVIESAEAAARQSLGIVNTGQGVMNWAVRAETVNGGNWLTASPAGGRSDAASLTVSAAEVGVNAAGLKAGSYAGVVRVDAPGAVNSPQVVAVTLDVVPVGSRTGVQVLPPALIFSARTGASSPPSQTVRITTSLPAPVEARGQVFTFNGGNWLEVVPANLTVSSSDPRTTVVQPKVEKNLYGTEFLAAGEYRGAVTYQFSDGSPPQAVEVFFLVLGPATTASSLADFEAVPSCTPTKLIAVDRGLGPTFTAQVGAASGLEVQVADDCGNVVADATVVANFSNGDAPVSLSYLRDGIYTGTWRPGQAGAAVTVTLRSSRGSLPSLEILRQGKVEEGAKTAAVYPGGVVHAASFAPNGALAPGSIISVFGANLASSPAGASSLPLPKTLAGASLQVGGYDVPLFYSSGGQINAQLPFELPVNTRPQLIVKGADFVTVPETITVAAARPGIFTTTQDGKGQGVIVDVNNRLVDASNPAQAGDIVVVYCTGLGATNPAVRSGEAAPASPLANVATPVQVTIGGQPATVQFAGLTPNFVGLYQVNVQIPGGVTLGSSVPLVISQDGVPSNTVTLALR